MFNCSTTLFSYAKSTRIHLVSSFPSANFPIIITLYNIVLSLISCCLQSIIKTISISIRFTIRFPVLTMVKHNTKQNCLPTSQELWLFSLFSLHFEFSTKTKTKTLFQRAAVQKNMLYYAMHTNDNA